LYAGGWNSKKIAEKAGISSIASVHKAFQGQILTKNEFIDGQRTKIIDEETLCKLVKFLEWSEEEEKELAFHCEDLDYQDHSNHPD
jgi:Ni,Fe-hydrogenase III component G